MKLSASSDAEQAQPVTKSHALPSTKPGVVYDGEAAGGVESVKPGDIMLVGIAIPEGYEGCSLELVFDDFCSEPNGWDKMLEGIRKEEG